MSKQYNREEHDFRNDSNGLLERLKTRVSALRDGDGIAFVAGLEESGGSDRMQLFMHADSKTSISVALNILQTALTGKGVMSQADVLTELFKRCEIDPAAVALAAMKVQIDARSNPESVTVAV